MLPMHVCKTIDKLLLSFVVRLMGILSVKEYVDQPLGCRYVHAFGGMNGRKSGVPAKC